MTREIYSALRAAAAATPVAVPRPATSLAEGLQANRTALLRQRTLQATQALILFQGQRLLGGNLLGTPIDTRDTDDFYASVQDAETQHFNSILSRARDRILREEGVPPAPVDAPSGQFLAARILSGEFQPSASPIPESLEAQRARETAEAIQKRYQTILRGIRSRSLAISSITELPSAESRPRESDILGVRFSENPISSNLRLSLYRRFTLAPLASGDTSLLRLSEQALLRYNDDFEGLTEEETRAKQRELKLSDEQLLTHRLRLLDARPTHVLVALSGRYNAYLAQFDNIIEQQRQEGNTIPRYSTPSGQLELERSTEPNVFDPLTAPRINGIETHLLTYNEFLRLRYVSPAGSSSSQTDYLSVVAFKSPDGGIPQSRTAPRGVFRTIALSTADTDENTSQPVSIRGVAYTEFSVRIPAEQGARFKNLSVTLQGNFPTDVSALSALEAQDLSLEVRQLGRESGLSANLALLDGEKNAEETGNTIALKFFSPSEGAEDGVQLTLRVKDSSAIDLESINVRFS